jgi:hypothetical protein
VKRCKALSIGTFAIKINPLSCVILLLAEAPPNGTLQVTPAMEAGISDPVWSVEELCSLLPQSESTTKRIDNGIILKALREG